MKPVLGPDGQVTRQPLGFVAGERVSEGGEPISAVSGTPAPQGSGFARWLREGCGMYRYEPYAADEAARAVERRSELSARLMGITLRAFQPRDRR